MGIAGISEAIVRRHWASIFASLRAGGRTADDAADLTQSFFADVVLGRKVLERADLDQEALQALLHVALRRYETDVFRRRRVRHGIRTVPFNELQQEAALSAKILSSDAHAELDQVRITTILEETMLQCRRALSTTGRLGHWQAFEAHVLRPCLTGTRPMPLADIAERFGFDSAAKAAAALQVVKRRAVSLFEEISAQRGEGSGDHDATFKDIAALLSTSAPQGDDASESEAGCIEFPAMIAQAIGPDLH